MRQTLLSEDTAGHTPRPYGRTRSPATVTQLASLRLSINKCLGPPRDGDADKGMFGFFSPRSRGRTGWWRRGQAPLRVCSKMDLAQTPAGAIGRRQLAMFAGANIGGGGDRARTDDPLLAKQVLSQLSYTPVPEQTERQQSEWQKFCRSDVPPSAFLSGGPGRI